MEGLVNIPSRLDEEDKQEQVLNLLPGANLIFRKLRKDQLRKIITTPGPGPIGIFQRAVLDTIWKLRFQRRIKQMVKSKVEVFKSYFALNQKRILFYEINHPPNHQIHDFEWDYVIVFPNPDAKDETDGISRQEALEHFDATIYADNASTQIEQRVMKKAERKAFDKVFKKLPDLPQDEDDKDPPKKAKFKGGRFFKNDMGEWHDRYTTPTDVQTLMMNVIQRKLTKGLGLHCRAMMSSDGANIFLLIAADEEDIQIAAEKFEQNVQIEIGWCDLYSMQPCDKHFYPYVQIIKDDNEIRDLEEDLKEYFKEIRQGAGDENDEDDDDEEEKVQSLDVVPHQWNIYKEYLKELKMRYSILNKSGIKQNDHARGLFLKKLTRKALLNANQWGRENYEGTRSITRCCAKDAPPQLYHLWERLGERKEIGPYTDYVRVMEKGVDKYTHLWRRYVIAETGERSIFKETVRLKVLDQLIQSKLVIRRLMAEGYVSDYFPLHNKWFRNGVMRFHPGEDGYPPTCEDAEKEQAYDEDEHASTKKGLEQRWKYRCCDPFYNPANKVRAYFGEKIALYFEYICFYSKFLFWTGFFGTVVLVLQYLGDQRSAEDENFRYTVIVFNALYMLTAVLWSTFFFEFWKRKENKLAIEWGQTDFEEDEIVRPTFVGIRRRSPVDDSLNDIYFHPQRRRFRQAIGYLISIAILIVVLGTVAAILYLRYYLRKVVDPNSLFYKGIGSLCSTINAIQIIIFNMIYNKIALWLTNWENHRTHSDFEAALISKTFLFQFVNSFNSLFYMAFIKRSVEGCVDKNTKPGVAPYCGAELRNQITIIFVIAVLKNFMEIGLPLALNWLRERKLRRQRESFGSMNKEQRLRLRVEEENALSKYESLEVDGTYSDYIEMMVQYGYIILFSVGFPMAPVLGVINNIVEVQVDKYKLMKLTKRPVPLSANNIGMWALIIDIVTTISIFTNMGVFCFTISTFEGTENDVKFYVFIALVIVFMCIRFLISYAVPDISENMSLVIRRHDYLVEKELKGFIKQKPRSILPEKSNFTVGFTVKDNREMDELDKVQTLFNAGSAKFTR